ncbi:hypothetical protein F5Y08DRAFT_75818 [Xylaria arbuscula]|nr:hypothetical protein F5Y08DRAFT_75818 [Xylaria arbuscula]
MGLPYQCLSRLGSGTLFCAARGCSIQTYNLSASSQPLFTWTHPSIRQVADVKRNEEVQDSPANGAAQTERQPPSKRRKIASDEHEQEKQDVPTNGEKGQKKGKTNRAITPEIPFVILLTATEDGSHVIAVTGQDKTLWVFEHDGQGSLKELSQRAMPKRPCSLALTADGQTILSADKFGDVYALPLIPNPEEEEETKGEDATSVSAVAASEPSRGANIFTVHSQRNRRALEDQQRQRESNAKRDLPKDGPRFAHEVLLGHVSLLTCVLTAKDAQGRPYILTADRDEHIRVSRGIPQAHVIETYCLGHESFVSALCIIPQNAPRRPDILVSGGGDSALFVWDWLAGKLLGTTDLSAHVREVLPDKDNYDDDDTTTSKIAVTKLISYAVGDECFVAATCERIPAIFIFQLRADNTVSHRSTLALRGNPLDMMILGPTEPSLLVATDVPDSDGGEILVFEREGTTTWVPQQPIRRSMADSPDEHPPLSREDLDKVLYTVENLRKTGHDGGGDEGGAPETPEQNSEIRE